MNELAAPTAERRVVLLIKSQKIAHQAGYYLLNGRWHKVAEHKPAPKGAPVAAHPVAAGLHQPVTLEPGQVDALKYAADKAAANSEMAAFNNVHLPKLVAHAANGDATAILGHGYGSNTHGKKAAKVANYLLGEMGSPHQVTAGQKAGEHHAVKQTPAAAPAEPEPVKAPVEEPKAAEPAPVEVAPEKPAASPGMPAFVEGKTTTGVVDYYQAQAQKILDMSAAGDVAGLTEMMAAGLKPNSKGKVSNTFAGKTANSKMLLELHGQALEQAGKKVDAVMEANPPAPVVESAAPTLKEKLKETAAALANDPDHQEALAIAAKVTASAPTAASMVAQIPWDAQLLPDSNTNAKSHNGKVAQIKAMAEAGDLAGLEAFKAGKNTYGKKQTKLAELAAAALKEGTPAAAAPEPAPAAAPEPVKLYPADLVDLAKWVSSGSGDNPKLSSKWAQLSDEQKAEVNDFAASKHGPQDGDTKAGADGTLVFKDGRWHKQDAPVAAEPAPAELSDEEKAAKVAAYLTSTEADEHLHAEGKAIFSALPEETKQALNLAAINNQAKAEVEAAAVHPIDAVPMPDLTWKYPSHKAKVDAALEKLKAQIKAEGPAALKGVTKTMSSSGKLITKLPGEFGSLKVIGYEHAPDLAGSKVHAYVEELKAAAGKPSKKPKAKPAPVTAAPHADQNAIPSMDDWKQVGPQGGSNPGGKFTDEHGTEWYCKFPADADVAKSEVLAAKLYGAAGIAGQDAMLVTKDGKLGIASKWQEVKKADTPAALAKVDGVASGFAADAWLGNWDVVGLGYDNLQVDAATGKAVRVDAGGSLEYRAQGGKKSFGNVVTELDSLRDKAINPQAAKVFGHLSNADITAGVAKVLKVSDAQIHALVNTYGPGTAADKKALAETLIARKADLLAKFPKAKKSKTITFKPEKISEPPSFLNWGGSGNAGPSSKLFLNEANDKAVQSIYEAAKTGSVDAVKNLTAETYNKSTGEVTGSAPVLEHPSQHVKGYAQQAVNEITQQLNPPKRFRFEGGHPLHSLNSAYPSHKGPPHSDAVEKAGKFLVLGDPGTISLDALALPKVTYASGALTRETYSPVAKAAIAQMPETQKQAVKSYTGSSYQGMNSSLWTGNPSGAAKAAGEALHALGHEIAPGTVLSRKLTVSGAGLDQILKSTGKVLQEPAIMSTSIRPSSWSGNVQLKLHVGPGVKGLWVGKGSLGSNSALSMNAGEDELILPPNTRLLILSVKKSGGGDADGFGADSQHVIEAVVLPTMQANP